MMPQYVYVYVMDYLFVSDLEKEIVDTFYKCIRNI